jgi:hypothetical protein
MAEFSHYDIRVEADDRVYIYDTSSDLELAQELARAYVRSALVNEDRRAVRAYVNGVPADPDDDAAEAAGMDLYVIVVDVEVRDA